MQLIFPYKAYFGRYSGFCCCIQKQVLANRILKMSMGPFIYLFIFKTTVSIKNRYYIPDNITFLFSFKSLRLKCKVQLISFAPMWDTMVKYLNLLALTLFREMLQKMIISSSVLKNLLALRKLNSVINLDLLNMNK